MFVELFVAAAVVAVVGGIAAHNAVPMPAAPPVRRELPPVEHVISEPVRRPVAKPGEKTIVFSQRALNAADANADRLRQSAERYNEIRRTLGK